MERTQTVGLRRRVSVATEVKLMDASGGRRMVGTASGVAIEPQFDEEVVCQDTTGELSKSLSEVRKEEHRWRTKWTCVRWSQTKVIDSRVVSRA